MSRKTSTARRAAFLRALGETGNYTVAAERAKVSRSWVRLTKTNEPNFAAQCVAAVETARERLRGVETAAPDVGWRDIAGEELVVRGTNGAAGADRAGAHPAMDAARRGDVPRRARQQFQRQGGMRDRRPYPSVGL